MSRSPSKASRAAYKRCAETCQKVRAEIHEAIENVVVASLGENHSCEFLAELTDAAFDAAFDAALAHGTEPIRDALIDCEEELMEAQEALATAEDDRDSYIREAASWESKSYDLEADVRALESELDAARSS